MAQENKAGIKAQAEYRFPDNTNEEITPLRQRQMVIDSADTYGVLNDTATITGVWEFATNPTVPLIPTAIGHAISKKYFDDNASVSSGDVQGGALSVDNAIVVYDGITGKVIKGGTGVSLSGVGDFSNVGNITFATATKTIAGIQNGNLLDKSISQTVSAGWTISGAWTISGIMTHTVVVKGVTPLVDADLATKKYVDDNGGVGDVLKVGTPVNNQLGVWTGDGTIEGDSNVTWSGSVFNIGGSLVATSNITTIAPTVDLHAATKKYVDDNSGVGDVVKVGSPVDNQVGIWTGNGTLEGDSGLIWNGGLLTNRKQTGGGHVIRDPSNAKGAAGYSTKIVFDDSAASNHSSLFATVSGLTIDVDQGDLILDSVNYITMPGLPTSDPGGSGRLWNNAGVINIT